jgi:hypothetical protein
MLKITIYKKPGLIALAAILIILVCGVSIAAVPQESLVGAWLFDGKSGQTAEDSSENGHSGEILGPKRVQGKYGTALEFDGKDDIVEIPHDEAFDLVTYTVMAWIKVDGPNGEWQQTVVGKGLLPAGKPRNFGVYVENEPGGFVLGINHTSGNAWQSTKGTTVIADGVWHHVASTYDGVSLLGYTDGNLEAQNAAANIPDHNTDPVRIGRWAGERGDFIRGIIDEVAILNEALSEDEIKDAMTGLTNAFGLAVKPSSKLATTWSYLKSVR